METTLLLISVFMFYFIVLTIQNYHENIQGTGLHRFFILFTVAYTCVVLYLFFQGFYETQVDINTYSFEVMWMEIWAELVIR